MKARAHDRPRVPCFCAKCAGVDVDSRTAEQHAFRSRTKRARASRLAPRRRGQGNPILGWTKQESRSASPHARSQRPRSTPPGVSAASSSGASLPALRPETPCRSNGPAARAAAAGHGDRLPVPQPSDPDSLPCAGLGTSSAGSGFSSRSRSASSDRIRLVVREHVCDSGGIDGGSSSRSSSRRSSSNNSRSTTRSSSPSSGSGRDAGMNIVEYT
jgi:hypothetical protein